MGAAPVLLPHRAEATRAQFGRHPCCQGCRFAQATCYLDALPGNTNDLSEGAACNAASARCKSARAALSWGDSAKSVGRAALSSNAVISCGHSALTNGRVCDAGDAAFDVVSSHPGHAVTSTCMAHNGLGGEFLAAHMSSLAHTGLGGGACALCSDRSNTVTSAMGTKRLGNFNASVARLESNAMTVMLSCAGQGTCNRFKCRKHNSKDASVSAGARRYSCSVCSTTGAMP